MANGKWILHYGELNDNKDSQKLEFISKRKRLIKLQDKIIGASGKVFLLAIDETNGDGSSHYFQIYIFENWLRVFDEIMSFPASEVHLYEYSSYEDAYLVALNMREANPMCYNNK